MDEQIIKKIQTGKDALVIGGSNGVGLALVCLLSDYCNVTIVDKVAPSYYLPNNVRFVHFDLLNNDFSLFDTFGNIDKLIITAGFGKLALFKDYSEELTVNMMTVNATAVIRIIQHFYNKIAGVKNFYCGVMVSIAGFMSSPFFAVYGASKAALKIFIESVNVELKKTGSVNQILNVSPGSLKGTAFNGNKTDLDEVIPFAKEFLIHLFNKDDLFIPKYDEIFRDVLERYHNNFRLEGEHSYDYKLNSGRIL